MYILIYGRDLSIFFYRKTFEIQHSILNDYLIQKHQVFIQYRTDRIRLQIKQNWNRAKLELPNVVTLKATFVYFRPRMTRTKQPITPMAIPAATPYLTNKSPSPFFAASAFGSGHPSPARAALCMETAAARQFPGSEMGPSGYSTCTSIGS